MIQPSNLGKVRDISNRIGLELKNDTKFQIRELKEMIALKQLSLNINF